MWRGASGQLRGRAWAAPRTLQKTPGGLPGPREEKCLHGTRKPEVLGTSDQPAVGELGAGRLRSRCPHTPRQGLLTPLPLCSREGRRSGPMPASPATGGCRVGAPACLRREGGGRGGGLWRRVCVGEPRPGCARRAGREGLKPQEHVGFCRLQKSKREGERASDPQHCSAWLTVETVLEGMGVSPPDPRSIWAVGSPGLPACWVTLRVGAPA